MKKKKLSPEQQLQHYVDELTREYDRWQYYLEFGGQDPTWSDGVNMNLIRNHTMYYRDQIIKLCEESGLPVPEIYSRPVPEEMPNSYMARSDEIRSHAKKALEIYEADSDYRYLLEKWPKISKRIKETVYLDAVMGYVDGLRSAIEQDNLVYMRRHERPDGYIDSFRSCAEKLREALIEESRRENVQLTLFD